MDDDENSVSESNAYGINTPWNGQTNLASHTGSRRKNIETESNTFSSSSIHINKMYESNINNK